MRRKSKPATYLAWHLTILLIFVAGTAGCGVKAPPIPPQRNARLAPVKLEATVDQGQAILTWPVDGNPNGTTYAIFRSQALVDAPDCSGCPRIFQKIDTLATDPTANNGIFREPLTDGYINTYKVQPINSSGELGPESNTVVCVHRKGAENAEE